MTELILASGSPRRKEMLTALGVDFEVVLPMVDETKIEGETPAKKAELAADTKARWVAERCSHGVVIAADTIVVRTACEVLGKPQGAREAVDMLLSLSGDSHHVITGASVISPSKHQKCVFHVSTKVVFRSLSKGEVERYVATGEPMDKAGAYGIQGRGALLVKRIEGCYFNVVGLPLPRLGEVLQDFGIILL